MNLVLDISQNIDKQIVEPKVASLATNIVFKTSQRSIKPQNCPIPREHGAQGLHVFLGEAPPTLFHSSTPTKDNHLPI
jgi:hypothetical protein